MYAPNRLRRTEDFAHARKAGRSWGHPLLALQAVDVGGDVTRCGFVTSKRVGNAVVRNRVRRRLRDIVRHLLPRIAPGRDLVFVARPAAAQADLATLRAAVEQLLVRARLFTPLREGAV